MYSFGPFSLPAMRGKHPLNRVAYLTLKITMNYISLTEHIFRRICLCIYLKIYAQVFFFPKCTEIC